MMDSDVWKLYQDLLNKKYENVDDFLTSSPLDECNHPTYNTSKEYDPHITFDGMEITDFTEEMDYGL